MKNKMFSNFCFSQRLLMLNESAVFFNSGFFSRQINSIDVSKKNLILLPKILISHYTDYLQQYFNIEPKILFDKNNDNNSSNINLLSYSKMFKLINNIEEYGFEYVQCIELQTQLSNSFVRNLLLKNAKLSQTTKSLFYIINKIDKFQAKIFSYNSQEDIFIFNEFFNSDALLYFSDKFHYLKENNKNFIINSEFLEIKENLIDF